ncbi:MAG: GNAT family N-acetyltransferase [Cyanobacteria bacterium J06635_1]
MRIFTSTDKREIALEELNRLFEKAGFLSRPLDKLDRALEHSLFCVAARSLREKTLVGFVRATSDGVFNTTVWDLVVDPCLPNQDATKKLLMTRLKREVVKVVPSCAISTLANPQDYELFRQMSFDEDKKGIRAMALRNSRRDS